MRNFFRAQLAVYAEYHRDERNCLTHILGIPILFLAAVLPFSLWPLTAIGVQTSLATVMVIPALVVWMLFDFWIGLAIIGLVIPVLLAADAISNHVSAAGVWIIALGLFVIGWTLQIVGHAVFERRRPALIDNPLHMLIGPMFVVAKLCVALGFRLDLAGALQSPQQALRGGTLYPSDGRGDFGPHP
jgi:uncharacterized membrane protein YGL010W